MLVFPSTSYIYSQWIKSDPVLNHEQLKRVKEVFKLSDSWRNVLKLLTYHKNDHYQIIPINFKLPKFKGVKGEEQSEQEISITEH